MANQYWLKDEQHLRNADRAEHYLDRVLEIAPDAVEAKTNSRVLRVTPTALRVMKRSSSAAVISGASRSTLMSTVRGIDSEGADEKVAPIVRDELGMQGHGFDFVASPLAS